MNDLKMTDKVEKNNGLWKTVNGRFPDNHFPGKTFPGQTFPEQFI